MPFTYDQKLKIIFVWEYLACANDNKEGKLL